MKRFKQPTTLENYDFDAALNIDDIMEWLFRTSISNPENFTARNNLGMYEVKNLHSQLDCPESIKKLYTKVKDEYGPIYKSVGFLAIDDDCKGYGWHNDAWDLVVANYTGGPTTWEFKKYDSITFPDNQLMYIPKTAEHRVIGNQARFSLAFCLQN